MSKGITVYKLNPTDQATIVKLANWYFNEWKTPIETTIEKLSQQPNDDVYFWLVLSLDGEVIGAAGLCNQVNLYKEHPNYIKLQPWVAMFYTEKEHRNKGLGKLLLNQLEENAKACGLTKIYLYTFTAENLYKRCGWKTIDHLKYKGYDTVVMEKEI